MGSSVSKKDQDIIPFKRKIGEWGHCPGIINDAKWQGESEKHFDDRSKQYEEEIKLEKIKREELKKKLRNKINKDNKWRIKMAMQPFNIFY